jgi:hypothetical protein
MFKQTVIGLTCFLLGLVGGLGAVSHSQVRLEASVGRCEAKGKDQGQWWTDMGAEMVSEKIQSSCYQVGVSELTHRISSLSLGWRASYVDLGALSIGEEAFGGVGPQPHWTATGSGYVRGVSFGAIAEKPFGYWKLTAEGGFLGYQSGWEAVAYHVSHDVSVEANPGSKTGTAFYYGAGLGYTRKKLTLEASFRRYPTINFNTVAPNADVVGPSQVSVNVAMISGQWSF